MEKIYLHSLGCSKNLVDSENMLGILNEKNYQMVEYADNADYIIINTCSFINDAKEESINAIIEAASIKDKSGAALIVAGCLSQRYGNELMKEIPEIDMLIGTFQYGNIDKIIDEYKINNSHKCYIDMLGETENLPRISLTPKHYAYIKIAEGCNNKCTYCIIPKIRGKYRSRSIEDIIDEARILAKNGVKELIIIAQDTSKYGIDLYNEKKLHEVIRRLSDIQGIEWIRIHYLYPEDFYDDLIDEFKNNKKLVKYFDIPLQHISNSILKKMNRRTNKEEIVLLINKIRTKVKGAVLRTSLITGFPGETEEEHEELKDFLNKFKLDKVGVFKYSREEDTAAYKLSNQIDELTKERRKDELMQIQQSISYKKNRKKIGSIYRVLIDEKEEEDLYVGRTYMDSPEIDGYTFVKTKEKLVIGNYYDVVIKDALEYDLIGELV